MTGTWGRRLRDNGICLSLLLLLPLGVHVLPWLDGDVPQASGQIFSMAPWESHDASGQQRGDGSLSSWQLRHVWPAYQFLSAHRHSLSELRWNPTEGFGVPFLANPENRSLSPFSVFFYIVGFELALLLSVLAKGVAAGWIAFYVARRYGFTPWYALLVALIFQWSGPVFLWGMEPVSDSLVLLPLLLLATDRLILGQFRAWPGLALVVGLMVLCGDIRLVVASLVTMGLYMLLRKLRDHRRAHLGGGLPGFLVGACVGVGLAAVQILPYLELLREGNAIDHGYPWMFEPSLLRGLFGPAYVETTVGISNPLVHIVYVGVIPLLFLGLWGALRRVIERPIRHRVESLMFASLVVAAVPVLLQGLLPAIHGLRFLHPVHYLAGLSLPLGLMVAGVVESWIHLNADQCKRALFRMTFWLPPTWGGPLVAFFLFARDTSGQMAIHWPTFWVFTVSALGLLVLFGGTLLYPKAHILVAGTSVLLVLTTAWGTLPWQPRSPREDIFPQTEVIRSLQEADARVGGSPQMADWPLAGNQIPALYAPGRVALNRTRDFLEQVATNPLLQRRAAVGTLLLRKEDIQGAYAPVRPDLNIKDVFETGLVLFRDHGAAPRYRIVHDVEKDASVASALQVGGLPVVPDVSIPPLSGPVEDTVRVIDVPRNDSLALEVETSHPGVLVVAEAWFPGWQADVNGNPVSIIPVDGVLRGVELGAGKHQIRFEYRPESLRWGALISAVSLAMFLIGAFLATRHSARRF